MNDTKTNILSTQSVDRMRGYPANMSNNVIIICDKVQYTNQGYHSIRNRPGRFDFNNGPDRLID